MSDDPVRLNKPWGDTRLWDRVQFTEFYKGIIDSKAPPILVVDNVAEYMFERDDEETWEIKSFPNIAPPFEEYWMEAQSKRGYGDDSQNRIIGTGALIKAVDFEQEEGESTVRDGVLAAARNRLQDEAFFPAKKTETRGTAEVLLSFASNPGVRWAIAVFPVYEMHHEEGTQLIKLPIVWIPVAHNGQLAEDMSYNVLLPLSTEEKAQSAAMTIMACAPFMFATSLLHCKNVEMEPRRASRQIRRRAEREGQPPPSDFHVLTIEPMKKVIRYEGGSESIGLKRALHLVRGHFSDYRQRGLFGKHKGIYWWNPMVRGTADRVVEKSYRIKRGEK